MLRRLNYVTCLGLTVGLAACSADAPPASSDAGTTGDAGTTNDAGSTSDAAEVDAGLAPDTGLAPDSGLASDSGLAPDTGVLEVQTGLEVQIRPGAVRGASDGDIRIFKGIPFAEPPIGNGRFRPPVPVAPWDGTFEADDYGPACPQTNLGPEFLLGNFSGPQSEDCLSLNVWAHSDPRLRPVMVFIFGGGFVSGASAWPLYEATKLARRGDVVVVTINYRVGAFGFLATEELAAESGNDSAGNYGLQDQLEALRWVQANIRAFGGDSDNVTIFGESAGAISVCALMGAPSADSLFHKAIMQSGMCTLAEERSSGVLGVPSIMEGGQRIVEAVGCADAFNVLNCLRSLDVDDLVAVASLASIFTGDLEAIGATSPHVDGALIPEQPLQRLRSGARDIPLIVGSNEDEGLLFSSSAVVVTRNNLQDAIAGYVGSSELAAQVTELYPASEFFFPSDAWVAFLGEVTFICPGLSAARAASSGAPAFAYHFVRAPFIARAVGVAHGLDLFYIFDSFTTVGLLPAPGDSRVAEAMQRAWAGFSHHGAPPLDSTWPRYDPEAPQIALLDDPSELTDQIRNGRCEALEGLGLVP